MPQSQFHSPQFTSHLTLTLHFRTIRGVPVVYEIPIVLYCIGLGRPELRSQNKTRLSSKGPPLTLHYNESNVKVSRYRCRITSTTLEVDLRYNYLYSAFPSHVLLCPELIELLLFSFRILTTSFVFL